MTICLVVDYSAMIRQVAFRIYGLCMKPVNKTKFKTKKKKKKANGKRMTAKYNIFWAD